MPSFPVSELVKSLPGVIGIRLEDQPRFELLDRLGEIEIRRYLPEARAQVALPGTRAVALDRAFDVLAGYLFGENAEEREMSMTVPVYQQQTDQQRADQQHAEGWTIAFFLSNDMVPSELPAPVDSRIQLVRVPERYVASLRYTGNNTEARAQEAGETLLGSLRQQSRYLASGSLTFCTYDAPFTVPFLKRNEVQVALHHPS